MQMREEIQPGWMVVDRTGEEVGKVLRADAQGIELDIDGRDVHVPTSSLAEVETGRVELTATRGELLRGSAEPVEVPLLDLPR